MATIQSFMASAMDNQQCTPDCPAHGVPMIQLKSYHLAAALIKPPCQAHVNMLQHLTRGTRNPYFPPTKKPAEPIAVNNTPQEEIPTYNLQDFLNEKNEDNLKSTKGFLDYLKELL